MPRSLPRSVRAALVIASITLVAAPVTVLAAPGPLPSPWSARDKLVGDEPLLDPRQPLLNYRSRVDGAVRRGTPGACPHDFDVLHYEINLDSLYEFSGPDISGNTVIDFVSLTDALSSIDLDLKDGLVVSSAVRDGVTPLAFNQVGDVLTISFAAPPDSGDTVSVDVTYSGPPWNEGSGGFGGFWFSALPKNASSIGVGLNADPPSMGRTWFPCFDAPCDKATVDLNIETPLNRTAVANGNLVSVDSTATDHTWHWSHSYPISTYLIAVSVAPYRTLADSIVTDPKIDVYFHAGRRRQSEVSFQNVDLMMEACEARFGPYPYTGEKFAFMTTFKGDMEHQTCVSHAFTLVDSTNTYDDILAHELTHQWFGDWVTYDDWRDIWLSEGFATYGEAVYREYKNGIGDYHAYVTDSFINRVLVSGATEGLHDPSSKWGVVSYEKGACVVHMLRGVLDDDTAFWQALRDYLAAHAAGTAVATDLIAAIGSSVGQDMSWFFDPWVFGEGHPIYEYGWSYDDLGGGQYRVDAVVRQVQTTASLFDLPVDFRVQTGSGDFDFSATIDAAEQTVSFVVPAEPTGFLLDPDDWILDEQLLAPTSVDWGPDAAIRQALSLDLPRPNPFRHRSEIRYYVPRAGRVSVSIHDVAGRRVRALVDGPEQPGSRQVWWDRRTADGSKVAPGVYWVRLRAPDGERARKIVVSD